MYISGSLNHGQEYFDNGKTVEIIGECVETKEPYRVTVKSEDFRAWWYEGEYIQNVMPELSADDKEFLLSGLTPYGWEIINK